jgi:hypothetical protein
VTTGDTVETCTWWHASDTLLPRTVGGNGPSMYRPDAVGRHEAENVMTIDEIVELEEELRAANNRLAQHWLAYDSGELRDPAVPCEEGPRLLRHRNAVAAVLEYERDRRARSDDR